MHLLTRLSLALVSALALVPAAGCADSSSPESSDRRPEDVAVDGAEEDVVVDEEVVAVDRDGDGLADRPLMTEKECTARGTIVGDIGNGKMHRPDFRCANGKVPIGRLEWGIEGAVCCPN